MCLEIPKENIEVNTHIFSVYNGMLEQIGIEIPHFNG